MFFDEEIVRINTQKLLKEADSSRLIRQTRSCSARRRNIYAPVLAWLGVHLSRWGNLLQERFVVAEITPESQSMENGIKA